MAQLIKYLPLAQIMSLGLSPTLGSHLSGGSLLPMKHMDRKQVSKQAYHYKI